MSDLISRKAAMTMPVLPKEHRDYISFELDDIYEQGWNECQSFIAKLPSAQTEITRCKDCKWCEDADGLMCKNTASWVVATDYDFGCVLAERRQDG